MGPEFWASGAKIGSLGLQLGTFESKLGALHYGLNCVISMHITCQYIATFSLTNEPPERAVERSRVQRSRAEWSEAEWRAAD